MDTDIREAIERSFGAGPPEPDDRVVLDLGRRALRRRRRVEAAGAAVVVLVALGAAALAGGSRAGTHAGPEPAGPSRSASATPPAPESAFPPPAGTSPVVDPRLPRGWDVEQRPDGVAVSSRVELVRYVDDPWGLRPDGQWSAAVVYRDAHGVTTWWAGYLDEGLGGTSTSVPAENAGGMGFAVWVAQQRDDLVDTGGHHSRRSSAAVDAEGGGGPL